MARVWVTRLLLCCFGLGVSAAWAAPVTIVNQGLLTWQVQPGAGGSQRQQSSVVALLSMLPSGATPSSASMNVHGQSPQGNGQAPTPTTYTDDGGVTWKPVPAATVNGVPVDRSNATTTQVYPGAPLFTCVTDADQNNDATVAETVPVTVTSGSQTLRLQLTETGVNTGVFCGYFLTTPAPTGNAFTLAVAPGATVAVNYVDPSDLADRQTRALSVPRWNRVVDGSTGAPLDGVTLELRDLNTSATATVAGADQVSAYPNPMVSGTDTTDASGLPYVMAPGNFYFPRVAAGHYQLVLSNLPAGYRLATPGDTLTGGLTLGPNNASFGNDFTTATAGPVAFDIPLMPIASGLFMVSQGDADELGIGDLSQFTLTVENLSTSASVNGAVVTDLLPPGFRYEKGSVRVNGVKVADPVIGSDGRQLTFAPINLAAGAKAIITLVVRVTPMTPVRLVSNQAQATATGGLVSNRASHQMRIREDLMQSVNTLIGRIYPNCSRTSTADGKLPSLANIRVLLETGRYAITDELGRFHFAELANGTHVVQVDQASLPKGFELATCEENSRFAGRANSQFVELHGGALWRADFYLKQKTEKVVHVSGTLELSMSQQGVGEAESSHADSKVETTIQLNASGIPVNKLSLVVTLAKDLAYAPGTSQLDGVPIADPEVLDDRLVYTLGDRPAGWQAKLVFGGETRQLGRKSNDFTSTAEAAFDTAKGEARNTDAVSVTLPLLWVKHQANYVVHYVSGKFAFDPVRDAGLADLLNDLQYARDIRMVVHGHTDSVPVRAGGAFADNYQLSRWRAKELMNYLKQRGIALPPDEAIDIKGFGPDQPVGDNKTTAGKAANRRVEVQAEFSLPEGLAPGSHGISDKVASATDDKQVVVEPEETLPQPRLLDGKLLAEQQHYTLDQDWLDKVDIQPEIVWPTAEFVPASSAIQVAVKHRRGETVELSVNDKPVSTRNFEKRSSSADGRVEVDQWLGVGIQEGANRIVARILRNGRTITTLEQDVHFSGAPVRVEVVEDQSWLVADGQHRPFVALRFYDRWGKVLRTGMSGNWQVEAPFQPWQSEQELQQKLLIAGAPRQPSWTVADDNLAYLVLAPTTESGRVNFNVPLPTGNQQLSVWLTPAQRDWVLVGLANGSLVANSVRGHLQGVNHNPDDDLWQDDRVAFYAKGMVQGKWLVTAAYDTAKQTGVPAQGLEQMIDPNHYYMLYADASQSGFDADSSKKLYLKIERDRFYALFGNFNTGLTVTDLARYERRFTGVKSGYDGKLGGYTAFAAENSQAGVHDEIQGNGTSGLYSLSHRNVLLGSETVSLVTRDRFTNAVISTQTLGRFTDYNLDTTSGKLFFRTPVPDRDAQFNPIYIVVDYEVESNGREAITGGGRAYVKLADGRVEVGATGIQESAPVGNNRLTGADVKAKLTDTLTLKAEIAHTHTDASGTSASLANGGAPVTSTRTNDQGDAYGVSLEQQGEKLRGKVYYQKVDDGFGLGQQSLADVGTEKYGWDGRYDFTRVWAMTSRWDEQRGLAANSRMVEAGALYQEAGRSLNFGARHTESDLTFTLPGIRNDGRSDQLYVGGSMDVGKQVTLRGQTSQAIGGNEDSMAPSTTQLGVDYRVTQQTRLFANQTFAGESSSGYSRMTEVGLNTQPAAGTQVSSSVTQQQTEYGPRLFATSGLTQTLKLNDAWTLSGGASRSQTIRAANPTPSAAGVSAYADTQDFTSAFLGSGYQANGWVFTNRAEYLTSKSEEKYGLFGGLYSQLSASTAVSTSLQWLLSDFSNGDENQNLTLRFGVAHRPLDSAWSILNQTDMIFTDQHVVAGSLYVNTLTSNSQQSPSAPVINGTTGGDLMSWRLVNNFNVNWKRDDTRWQVSGYYGNKYARYNFTSGNYGVYTDLLGLETRFDLTRKWDIGLAANTLHDWKAKVRKDRYGIETGYDVATNLWLSIGYNFKGFYDEDFTATHYTAEGVFLRFRFKFDQDTLKAMARGWH